MQVKIVNRYKNVSKAQAKFEFIDVFFCLLQTERRERTEERLL